MFDSLIAVPVLTAVRPNAEARAGEGRRDLDVRFGWRDGKVRWRQRVPAAIVMFPPERFDDGVVLTLIPAPEVDITDRASAA